eukprot:SAG31_NODE_4972_length_2825_cov_2.318782_1_plen_236_part_00
MCGPTTSRSATRIGMSFILRCAGKLQLLRCTDPRNGNGSMTVPGLLSLPTFALEKLGHQLHRVVICLTVPVDTGFLARHTSRRMHMLMIRSRQPWCAKLLLVAHVCCVSSIGPHCSFSGRCCDVGPWNLQYGDLRHPHAAQVQNVRLRANESFAPTACCGPSPWIVAPCVSPCLPNRNATSVPTPAECAALVRRDYPSASAAEYSNLVGEEWCNAVLDSCARNVLYVETLCALAH